MITSDFLEQAGLHLEGNVAVLRHYRYISTGSYGILAENIDK